jgi:hypothetical protein
MWNFEIFHVEREPSMRQRQNEFEEILQVSCYEDQECSFL